MKEFNIALTYHDPNREFDYLLLEALTKADQVLGPHKTFVHVSTGTRMANPAWYESMMEMKMAKFLSTKEGTESRAIYDYTSLARQLPKLNAGKPLVYIDADTFAMCMVLFPKETKTWIDNALVKIAEGNDTVFLQRSKWALDSYPGEQRITEPVLNRLISHLTELDNCKDFTSGFFVLSGDAVVGWEEGVSRLGYLTERGDVGGGNMQETVLSLALFKKDPAKHVLGLDDHNNCLGCFETNWVHDQHRPRRGYQLDHYFRRELPEKIDTEKFRNRCELVSEWMTVISCHPNVAGHTYGRGFFDLSRTIKKVIEGEDPVKEWQILLGDGYFERTIESHSPRGVERA